MALDYVVLSGAEADYESIVRYLAHDLANPGAAVRFMDEFDAQVELVCTYPELHAPCALPELAELGYRSFRVMRYLVLYKVADERVVIAHLFHERQDYGRLVVDAKAGNAE